MLFKEIKFLHIKVAIILNDTVVLCDTAKRSTITMKLITFLLFLAGATMLVHGQFVNGRFLETPIPEKCAARVIDERYNGKGYFFSWNDPTIGEKDWLGGRNYCRQRCMDLVSPESKSENDWIKSRLVNNNIKYIWTSGRLCDFKGCDRTDLQPVEINGWFWTAILQKMPPTTNREQNDWSEGGGIGKPQPDNRELIQGGAAEHCVAILNNFYEDGVHWHDVACHHVKPFICEEHDELLAYVRHHNPNLGV